MCYISRWIASLRGTGDATRTKWQILPVPCAKSGSWEDPRRRATLARGHLKVACGQDWPPHKRGQTARHCGKPLTERRLRTGKLQSMHRRVLRGQSFQQFSSGGRAPIFGENAVDALRILAV